MIRLKIEAIGFKELQNALTQVARTTPAIVHPELRNLGERLARATQQVIDAKFSWHKRLSGSVKVDDVSDKEVDVVEDGDRGKWIRYGTRGSDKKPPPNSELVEWCETKLGIPPSESYSVAIAIRRYGTLSPNRGHYPTGWRGYEYPEYIVMENQPLIQQYADRMGSLLVKYLDVHTK